MKILLVAPGASWSVADVWSGLRSAMIARGHEVIDYGLEGRMESSRSWLQYQWRRQGRNREDRPTIADMEYLACFEMPYRALRQKVDLILVVSGMYVHPDALVILKKLGAPVGVIFTESPYDDGPQGKLARLASWCWTNERSSVDALREHNQNGYYLPLAYDPEKHYPPRMRGPWRIEGITPAEYDVAAHDVVFVGTGWEERIDMLAGVDWTGIDLGLYGHWTLLGSRHPLRKFVRGGETDNRITAALYRRAHVGVNLYRSSREYGRGVAHVWGAESLNPRALELAACGTFHLSEYRPEVAAVFGEAVPLFDNSAQLEGAIRYYMGNPDRRAALADMLPGLVADRTFGGMMARIEDTVSGRSVQDASLSR